ncbi:hypothetical protein R1flu_009317 [Riccia fluitans]|uniref:Bet v I/Major latex protein domain-containing protein n=1 Tax=Riccia fluitans TaxID=41844 RepID=A0ABD1Z1Q7_9MARC
MPVLEFHIDVAVPAASLWGAIERERELMPKYAPEWFSSIEYHEGEGNKPGSVYTVHFGEELKDHCGNVTDSVKFKLIAFDAEKRTVVIEALEGGYFHQYPSIHRWTHTYTVVEVDDSHSRLQFITDNDGTNEEHLKAALAQVQEAMQAWIKVYLCHVEEESK